MKRFLKILKWIGIILLILTAGSIILQTKHAKNLCSTYKVGDHMPSIKKLASEYGLHPMGPYEIKESPGVQQVIFCAPATMCDISCNIIFKDESISEIEYVTH